MTEEIAGLSHEHGGAEGFAGLSEREKSIGDRRQILRVREKPKFILSELLEDQSSTHLPDAITVKLRATVLRVSNIDARHPLKKHAHIQPRMQVGAIKTFSVLNELS